MKHLYKIFVSINISLLMFFLLSNKLAASPVIDQSFTQPSGLDAEINECCAFVAQTFTAGLTGTLAGVSIDISSNSLFALHVAIHTVNLNGEPSLTVLGDATLNSSSSPLSTEIIFPQVINIVAGTRYAIVINYENAPPPGPGQSQGGWGGATGNYYTGGDLYFSVDGSSWTPSSLENHDVHFQTYVNPLEPTILDNFNRSNGKLGTNWSGYASLDYYKIANHQVYVRAGGPIYWSPTSLDVNQESSVTLARVNPSSFEHGLILKAQSGPNGIDYRKGVINVDYHARDNSVLVSTYRPKQGWKEYPIFTAMTFNDGDKLSAKAYGEGPNAGTVHVYKNGAEIGAVTLDRADQRFFNPRGGYIGLWFVDAPGAIFDNFGGGTP